MYRIHYSAWQWLIQKTAWSAMINKASNFRLNRNYCYNTNIELMEERNMLTVHITPIISLIAGVLILLLPRLLNYIVAIYLIIAGVLGLGVLH